MDDKEMFRKIIMQNHIQRIMNESEEGEQEQQIIELSRDDLLKSVFLGANLALNMLVYKGVATHEEIISMGQVLKEVIDDIFE